MAEVADILEELGIDYKDLGDNYRVSCWLHEDKTPSMFVHKATGVYHCFSCHTKGNLISLIRQHSDMEYHEILRYLQQLSLGGVTEEERKENLHKTILNFNQTSSQVNQEEECMLPENRRIKSHKYLMDIRKVTPDEIKKYDIRVCVDTNYNGFDYSGWVLIPIYFKGVLRSFFLRDPVRGRKIYGKYDRSDILYGYDNLEDHRGLVCVTEGMFDKYFCERIGQQTVAALSNRLLDDQLSCLRTFNEVVIFHDNDKTEAGLYLVKDALNLIHYTKVSVASLPLEVKDCADISRYSQEELLEFAKKAFDDRVNIIDFMASERYKKFVIMEYDRLYNYQKNKQKEG